MITMVKVMMMSSKGLQYGYTGVDTVIDIRPDCDNLKQRDTAK